MNKAQIKQLNKRIDKILSRKKLPIFPIMGGLSNELSVPDKESRPVTIKEAEIALTKGLACPILITLSREREFLEYLQNEHNKA